MIPQSGRRMNRVTILFLALITIGFIIATFDVRSEGDGVGDVLREGTQSVFTPAQKAVDWVVTPVVGLVDGVANLAGLRDENDRLVDRVRELEAQVRATDALEEQVAQLELINGLVVPEELSTVTARMYSGGVSPFDNVRFIDKGANDGVVVGQAVVDEDGLVGRVDLVSANDARIRLITDPLVSVGVRVQSTNETGIATGRGDGPLRLEMFRANEPVQAGDLVVTDGSRFPPGLVVGTVATTAQAEVGFVLRSSVDPAANLSEVDYVRVIVGFSPVDPSLETGDTTAIANPTSTTTTPTTTTVPGDG
ncbi:MAG: rod shape-determining protein MreC [Acidimicrobiia bacterium]|nr:rod shape-determining protein MreC [Acidimicrobiia bacterium]